MRVFFLLYLCFTSFFNAFANDNESAAINLIRDQQNNLAIDISIKPNTILYSYDVNEVGRKPIININSDEIKEANILYPASKFAEISGFKVNYYSNNVTLPITFLDGKANQYSKFSINVEITLCDDSCNIQKKILYYPEDITEISSDKIQQAINDKKHVENIIAEKDSENSKSENMLLILFYAFIGGMILNLMPCVLPVISIKILSLTKINSKKHMRFSIISMICGIIVSLLFLGLLTIFAKISGEAVGMGLHFQNINFLIFLYVILILMAVYIMNSWSISMPRWLNEACANKKLSFLKYSDSFLIGILTVIFSMPCTAPYLCIATSYAITANNYEIILIFFTIAMGLALPFMLLLLMPGFAKYIPKLAPMLEKIRTLLVILIMMSALWILYLIYISVGLRVAVSIFGTSLLIKFCLEQNRFVFKFYIAKIIILMMLLLSLFLLPQKIELQNTEEKNIYNEYWNQFSQTHLDNLKLNNKAVIINFTASWCLTCKVNQFLVFNNPEVINFLKSKNITGLVADLSHHTPPEILKIMNFYHRKEIPLTIFFASKGQKATILPIILTPSKFIEKIERLL